MSRLSAPSVFESFNARNLAPHQVAKNFIPPPIFDDLVLRRHSLVIGPRGSGKTTLLKMLQLPALMSWNHDRADFYRSQIDFVGVFVAADVSWGAQLKALGLTRKLPDEASRALSLAAFTSHVLIALVDAMRDCTNKGLEQMPSLQRHFVTISLEDEGGLVDLISSNWRLCPPVKSLLGLKLALRNRLSAIAELPQRLGGLSAAEILAKIRAATDLHLGFVEASVFAIEVFNEFVKQPDRRWALLFDELEIVPDSIRKSLFTALRSTDQRLLFKLSISPYNEDVQLLRTTMSAMPGQDYQPIELWYPRKEAGYAFSEALLKSMLSELGCASIDAEQIFDKSYFDSADEDIGDVSGYKPGGRVYNRFKALADRDITFQKYLQKNKVDLNKMHHMTETARAGLVRKVTSLVAVREAFRGSKQDDATDTKDRSRKNPLLYTGARALFAIVEGNPRWFIGLIGDLLRDYAATGQKVPRSSQARAITVASNRFRALLRTIPIRVSSESARRNGAANRGLLGLLDSIGDEFHKNVVAMDFSAEPVLSFVVDANTHPDILEALGKALNAGAIILVPDENGETLISSVRGKRFRLSYMLASGYKIPITLGRAKALSQILQPDAKAPNDHLFSWSDKQ